MWILFLLTVRLRSALQSLHKACEVARCHNYYPGSLFLTWISYYQSRISSNQFCINEWNTMQDIESHRANSPVLFTDLWVKGDHMNTLRKVPFHIHDGISGVLRLMVVIPFVCQSVTCHGTHKKCCLLFIPHGQKDLLLFPNYWLFGVTSIMEALSDICTTLPPLTCRQCCFISTAGDYRLLVTRVLDFGIRVAYCL